MTAKTFLDLVRAYADATLAACDAKCSLSTHRLDAARDLGALKKNPELAVSIAQWARGDNAMKHLAVKYPEHFSSHELPQDGGDCNDDGCTHNLGL